MSNKEEIFNIAARPDGEGAPVAEIFDATTLVAALRGILGFSFQDYLGRAVLPQLTTDGKLPVSNDAAGIHSEAHTTVTPVALLTRTLVTTAILTPDKLYNLKFASGSSTQTVLWEIEQTDDVTDSVRHKFISGSGSYTEKIESNCLEFQAGAAGVQSAKIYGTQVKGSLSDMHATLCLLQIGA